MMMEHDPPAAKIERVSCLAIIILAGIWGASRVASSGDLWVALGCGRYILSHGVTRTDPFSFNSPPGSWVNQNWLSHVLFALIQRGAGLAGLGLWKFVVSIGIAGLTASTVRALGASRALAALAAVAVAAMGRPFCDIRPNIHTVLLSAALIRWLVGIENRSLRRYWPAILLFVLWANLHGGFLFGIVALAAATGAVAYLRLVRRDAAPAWPSILLLPIAGLASTIISPFGITNLAHPYLITVGPDAAYWRHVVEWMPPYGPSASGEAGVAAFWILFGVGILIAATAFARSRGGAGARVPVARPGSPSLLPLGAISAAGLLLSLTSRRFIPLFSVAAVPLLALLARRIVPEARARRIARPLLWPVAAAAILAAACMAVLPTLFLANNLWPASIGFAERLVREDEQPSEAARFLATSGARGRVLTPWVWGGYLLYAEPFENGEPRYRIYLDGRAQAAYPADVSRDLSAFRRAAGAGDETAVGGFLDHYGIDFCVIDRREEGVASFLPKLDGWVGAYADDKSIVMARAARLRDLASGAFPDPAIREASAAFALRTRGALTASDLRQAFAHAAASLRSRPTTTGVTEMTRIALAVPAALGDSLRALADRECAAVLASEGGAGRPHEVLSIRANTVRCRAALAQASGDRDGAARLTREAASLADRAQRMVKRYLR